LRVPQVYVYLKQTRDIYELQNAIKEVITATPDMVKEAMRTLRDRLEQCRLNGGNT